MKALPRLLYFACFLALATVAVLALDRAFSPSVSSVLVRSIVAATLCAAPGLIWRKLWPLSVFLLPLGSYLVMRMVVPLPISVEGVGAHFAYYAEQLQAGASSFKVAAYPLPSARDPGLVLFVAFCTYWIAGATGFLALSMRRPLISMILLLAVLGFGLTVDDSARVVWMAILFVALSVLLFVLCRATTRETWRLGDWVTGSLVGIAGAFAALGLLLGAPSVAAEPWQNWRTWDPFGVSGPTYAFESLSAYRELLDPGREMPVMRVGSSEPSYWRAGALATFTGATWETSPMLPFLSRLHATEQPDGRFLYVLPHTETRPVGRTIQQSFQIEPAVATDHLFLGGSPQSLTLRQDFTLRMNRTRAIRVSTAVATGLHYEVTAVIADLDPAEMVGLGRAYSLENAAVFRTGAFRPYVDLPFPHLADLSSGDLDPAVAWNQALSGPSSVGSIATEEWRGLYGLNQTIISDASDPYEISLRIERYLRRFYDYDLAPPTSDLVSPYAAFLFDTRRGYCQHFAGAMAVLLRFNDIPSRVAVGFTSGEIDAPDSYLVTTNNAHAWVEAYFPTVGWVEFDPTPGRSLPTPGVSSTSPGFLYPFVESGDPVWAGVEETDSTSRGRSPFDETFQGASGQTADSGPSLSSWLPGVAGVIALFLLWPLALAIWRRRQLHRGGPWDQLRASLRLLRLNLASYGVPVTSAHTLGEALEVLGAEVGLEPDGALIGRVDAVLFGGHDATPQDVHRIEALRHKVNARLRKRHGWLRAWSVRYGLPRMTGT